jgi:hypothetical protein
MRSKTAASPEADLSLVFGRISGEHLQLIRSSLAEADEELRQLAIELAHRSGRRFETTGVTLDEFEGGAWSAPGAMLFGYVDGGDPRDSIAFVADLRRGEGPAGDADLWYVSGDVQVDPPPGVRTHSGMLGVSDLPEHSYDSPVEAAAGLLAVIRRLRALAATRPPTGEAWRAEAVR